MNLFKSFITTTVLTFAFLLANGQYKIIEKKDENGNAYQKIFFEDCDLIYFEREFRSKESLWTRFVILKQNGGFSQGDDNFENIAFVTNRRDKIYIYKRSDSRWRVRQINGVENGIHWTKIRLQLDDQIEALIKDGLVGWTINVNSAKAIISGHAQAELLPYKISRQLNSALEKLYSNDF
jgi:hypothetical protein